jgi:hypothetical protein
MKQAGVMVEPDTVAGYRVVRRIGAGGRSLVFLARGASDGVDARPVAVKVFRRHTDPAVISRQMHALVTTPATTLACLNDVATTPDGRACLVLEHLPGPALDRLMVVRGRLRAAEIVTIAATITASLQALHDSGLTHPMLRSSGVRFDYRGRPVLLGLGALEELPGGVAGVGLRRDAVVALTAVLHALLAYLDPADAAGPGAPALLAEFQSTAVIRPFPADLSTLEAALFAWATAGPVDWALNRPTGARAPVPMPAAVPRLLAVTHSAARPAPVAEAADPDVGRVAPRRRPEASRARRWAAVAAAFSDTLLSTIRNGRHRAMLLRLPQLPARFRVVRPVFLAASLVVVLSIGGVVLLSGDGERTGAEPIPAGRTPGPGAEPAAPDDPRARPERNPEEAAAGAVTGDDPAAAVLELLRRRQVCLATASVLCLDDVNQAGSVAMAADGYAIRQAQAGSDADPAEPDSGGVTLTAGVQERTGNSALVVLDRGTEVGSGVNAQPASALVIKGEAGWRLRELFDY